jgi:hypothetical protein
MGRIAVLGLRVLLVILFLGCIAAQSWFIPQLAGTMAEVHPEVSFLAVPYAVLAILTVACVEIALVSTWALLSKIKRDAIFTERAFRWVDAIIVSAAAATLIIFSIEIHLLGIIDVGEPPLGMLFTAVVISGTAFVLLMIVMRGLLRSATTLHSELEEVV